MSNRRRQRPKPQKGSQVSWPLEIPTLLTLLAFVLFWIQFQVLHRLGGILPTDRFATPSLFWQATGKTLALTTGELLLFACIPGIIVSLVLIEVLSRRFTFFLNLVFQTERRTLIFLSCISLVSVRFYLAKGEFSWSADTAVHTSYLWLAAKTIANGEIPIWTNVFGNGSPFLQFYGFLFFYISGTVDLLFNDSFFSAKLVMVSAHVLSGIGMYCFTRLLCGSRASGFLAGLAFVLCFWHTQQVLIMGRLPLSIFYALLPWPFYHFEQILSGSKRLAPPILGGVALAALTFTHPGYAFWAIVLLAAYVSSRLLEFRQTKQITFLIARSLLLLGSGLVLGAYLSLPMWMERGYTGLFGGFNMALLSDPTWRQLLTWSNYRFTPLPLAKDQTHWYGGYLGLSLVAMAAFALFRSLRPGRDNHVMQYRPAVFCLLISLLLIIGYRWPVLSSLPFVQALSSGRYLLFVTFFMCVLVGICASILTPDRNKHRARSKAVPLLLLAIIVDLGPTTFQHPYIHRDIGDNIVALPLKNLYTLKSGAAQFPVEQLPDYRVFYSTGRAFRARVVSWLPIKTGTPTFMGLYDELPLSAFAFAQPLEKLLNPVLEEEGSPKTNGRLLSAGIHLLNTRYAFGLRTQTGGKNRIVEWSLPAPSPVIVAPSAIPWEYPETEFRKPTSQGKLLGLLEAMRVDTQRNSCDVIPLLDYKGETHLGGSPRVEVVDHQVAYQRVGMTIRVSGTCFARLAYSYYPYLRVTVNGEQVEPLETAGRFIALRLGSGEQRIVLEPYLSPPTHNSSCG